MTVLTVLTSREELALERRRRGATYREIGTELGVHAAQARKIYFRALRRLYADATRRLMAQRWGGDW